MEKNTVTNDRLTRLARTWLIIALTDAIFSTVLVTVFYHSTFARLWQGVASVLLGPSALDGGTRTVVIGLVMHFGVALFWTTVFLILYDNWPALRRVVASRYGILKVAAIYGPCIWLVMSLVVIPSLTHRPPTINYRWWVQFFGHIPFVAIPIVWGIAGSGRNRSGRLP
jgi:hypothetical protein